MRKCSAVRTRVRIGPRRTFAILLLVGAVLLFAGVARHWIAGREKDRERDNRGLVVPASCLDFGAIWENQSFPWTLVLENPTRADVAIESFDTSCNCASIEPASCVVPRGQKVELTLTLSMGVSDKGAASPEGEEARITVVPQFRASGGRVIGWTLRGRVRSPLLVDRRKVSYEKPLLKGENIPLQSVLVTGRGALASLTATCPFESARVEVNRVKGREDQFRLQIAPNAELPPGPFRFEVVLEARSTAEEALPAVRVRVDGLMRSDVEALPDCLFLGTRELGDVATETVILRSLKKRPIRIEKVEASSADVKVEPATGTSADSKTFTVKVAATEAGKQEGWIRFIAKVEGDEKPRQVIVRVHYHGREGGR
jgi:hypothetical protein